MTNEKDIYKFDDSIDKKTGRQKHLHTLNGKKLTGATTILNVIAKPFLIPWAANMTAGFLKDKLETIKTLDQKKWELLLDEARVAHTKKKEKAGDYGTQTHEVISEIVKFAIENTGGIIKDVSSTNKSIQNFIDWANAKPTIFIASEKHTWSKILWVGGVCDIICIRDGKRWIVDIKTAKSGIYVENFWQVACYDMLFQEQGEPKADGYIILNLKENGTLLEKRSINTTENIKAFKACLDIYRIKEKIKSNL